MIFFDTEQCWEGAGRLNDGYACVKIAGRTYKLHRYMFEYFSGEKLGPKELACHKCNNRKCFNPTHIYKGNHKTNYEDAIAAGTRNRLNVERRKPIRDSNGICYESVNDAACKLGLVNSVISNQLRGRYHAVGPNKLTFSYLS